MNGMTVFLEYVDLIERLPEDDKARHFEEIVNRYKHLPKKSRRPYYKEIVRKTSESTIILTIWAPGGSTMPHEHGGSQAMIRVLFGDLVQELFSIWEEDYEVLERNEYACGEEIVEDQSSVHKIGNKSLRRWAVSLHLFEPPLLEMEVYNFEENWRSKVGGDEDTHVLTATRPKNAVPIWN
jgi:predicted metal-dependent enzyme (double-stranded beta helix superfamily)